MLSKALFLALGSLVFWSLDATAQTAPKAQAAWFCQTCSSTGDAENFVIANAEAKNAGGHRTIEVINLNTSYTWFIEYEYFPRDYPTPLIDSASPGTANDTFVAGTIIAAEEKAIVINISPKSQWSTYYDEPGFQSLNDWQPELLYPLLQLAWIQQNANIKKAQDDGDYKIIEAAIEYFFGRGPKATVTFSDGSTGQFEFDPLQDKVMKMLPGSGRYPNGQFYPFGGGGSNGDDYLKPFNGGGGYTLIIEDYYYSCAEGYQDSKPYYQCTEEF